MTSLALDNALQYFNGIDGELIVGSLPISAMVKMHGTPLYVYDLSVARRKVQRLRNAVPEQIEIHYAIKANPHPEIIAFFNALGLSYDLASLQELKTAIEVGVAPDRCGFAGPGKSRAEIAYAVAHQIQSLNVESRAELLLANEIAREMGKRINVAFRLNPPFALKRSGMQMNGGPSAFGIDVEQIPSLLKEIVSLDHVVFKGFHVFAGSQNLDADSLIQFFGNAFRLLRELAANSPDPIEMVNLGGGFGIPYFKSDKELDIERVGRALNKLLSDHQDIFNDTRFVIESGRYLVGECGIYVTRVRYKKESRGKTFLVVEGGLNHHLAATGNFGQVVRKNYPIAALQKMQLQAVRRFNIVGPLCTPLDVLGSEVRLPHVEEGDLLGIFASGAYGFTASPRSFLSHPEPREIVVNE